MDNIPVGETEKSNAKTFLEKMEVYLKDNLPGRSAVCKEVADEVAKAIAEKKNGIPKHKRQHISSPEGAFFKLFGAKYVYDYLRGDFCRLSVPDARHALLSESYRHFKNIASDSPRSLKRNPFTKQAGVSAQSIVDRWWKHGDKCQQSCPDLALRAPCSHTVVIEGKYYRKGGYEAAQAELVRGIYQCFFYRGLPTVPKTGKPPAWDYDYACLLAYDASDEGNLIHAWEKLKERNNDIATGLWDGSNIYVMVIRKD
jgi:hypothetical protein